MKVIDVHSHLYWDNAEEDGWQIPIAPPGPIGPEVYVQAVSHSLIGRHGGPSSASGSPLSAKQGASRAESRGGKMVVYAGSGIRQFRDDPTAVRRANEAVAQLVALAPHLFILGFTPDPFHLEHTLDLMDEWVNRRGAKIIGEIVPYIAGHEREGPEMDAIYEKAVALHVPINNHSSTAEDSAAVGRLAARHPNARIILAHIGGTWAFQAGIKVARAYDNVWADTSGWPMVAGGIMEVALKELGPSKLVFGIDYPLCDIDTWITRIARLPISDADKERIAWRNAAELMKLDR